MAVGFDTSFHLLDWLEELTKNLKKKKVLEGGAYPFPRVGSNLGIIAETSLISYKHYNVLLK